MLILTADSTNRIILYPKRNNITFTASTDHYGFHFVNQMNQKERLFLAQDISAASQNYQLFEITLTGTTAEILSAATVNLLPEGRWNYTIFSASATSLADITTTALEYGVATII